MVHWSAPHTKWIWDCHFCKHAVCMKTNLYSTMHTSAGCTPDAQVRVISSKYGLNSPLKIFALRLDNIFCHISRHKHSSNYWQLWPVESHIKLREDSAKDEVGVDVEIPAILSTRKFWWKFRNPVLTADWLENGALVCWDRAHCIIDAFWS